MPDNLDDTPGPPVVVSDGTYRGAAFSAHVPPGWRIITSESHVPQAVIFAAPDNAAVIRLISGQVEAADVTVSGQRTSIVEIELADGGIVTGVLNTPDDQWAVFEAVFEQVHASVRASAPAQ